MSLVDHDRTEDARALLAGFGDERPSTENADLSFAVDGGAKAIAPVVRALDEAGINVASLEIVEPSLDDVFVQKTGQHLEGTDAATQAHGVAAPSVEPA